MASIIEYAKRWEPEWGAARETANRIGIALFVAGLLHGVVENNSGYRVFLWCGITLIALSLMRRKRRKNTAKNANKEKSEKDLTR